MDDSLIILTQRIIYIFWSLYFWYWGVLWLKNKPIIFQGLWHPIAYLLPVSLGKLIEIIAVSSVRKKLFSADTLNPEGLYWLLIFVVLFSLCCIALYFRNRAFACINLKADIFHEVLRKALESKFGEFEEVYDSKKQKGIFKCFNGKIVFSLVRNPLNCYIYTKNEINKKIISDLKIEMINLIQTTPHDSLKSYMKVNWYLIVAPIIILGQFFIE